MFHKLLQKIANMKNLLRKIYYQYKLKIGYRAFLASNSTSKVAYIALRQMFVLTKGKSSDDLSEKISKRIGKYNIIDEKGILGFENKDAVKKAVVEMKRDGYYIFEKKLPESVVNQIVEVALTTECSYLNVDSGDYEEEKVVINFERILSPRYEIPASNVVNHPVFQSIIFDTSLLAFAQEYLGVKPIIDLIAFWWSVPFQGKGKSAAAQMYHFDLDRIKFLKFFFYLTDVDTNTGPHCYVKASHQGLPKKIDRDGRFTDEEVAEIYGADNLLEICGVRGSIIAVDTRGFHKGKELLKDKRLLFQIEFANSMFGQYYPPLKINVLNEANKEIFENYGYTYKQIFY